MNLDEEPLNLILKGIKVRDKKLKDAYKKIAAPEKEVRNSLKELILNKYVSVFDEKGKEINDYDIDKVLRDDVTLWPIWFRLTKLGEEAYYNKCDDFWFE